MELNIRAGEQGEGGFVEAAFLGNSEEQAVCQTEARKMTTSEWWNAKQRY